MLANSWAVFGYVGKQLGRHLYAQTREPSSMPLKVQHMEKSRMILIFQYLCFLRILSFVSSAFLRRVTKRQSCSSIFSGWCRMQDLKRHIRRGPSWLCYRLFDFQHTSVQSRARVSNLCHRTFRMESRPGCFRYFAAFFSRASKVLEIWKFAFDSSAFNLLCAF